MSKSLALREHHPVPPPVMPPTFQYQYFVCKWKKPSEGYLLEWDYTGLRILSPFNGMAYINGNNGDLSIPVDPLTAMSLGAVTPEQLEFPSALVATFNLLKD